ncbi:MAG: VWA domain-containing protein [Nanoarchaeota archaeon]
MGRHKNAYYFSLDALMAAILLIGGLILLSRFFVHTGQTEKIDVISKDILNTLNSIKVSEIKDPLILEEVRNGNITDLNKSMLLLIGEYWAMNQTEKAQNLSRILLENVVPEQYGVNITLGTDVIFSKNSSGRSAEGYSDVINSRRMISGIAKGSPLHGSSSAAYLKKIRNKRTASYAYFGGFEGQGNITKALDGIPLDVTSADISEIILELDVIHSFNLYINGDFCSIYIPSTTPMVADVFNATACNGSIKPGKNNFTFKFDGNINESYIAGGYIRIKYQTDEFQQNLSYGLQRYYFPEIIGVVNLYSSFSVPGITNSYKANITFFNNYSTFLTIGNDTVFNTTGSNASQNVYRERSDLNWPATTIPIRLGVLNVSKYVNQSTGRPADIFFVNDVSGSMAWCGLYGCQYRCRLTSGDPYIWFTCQASPSQCTDAIRPCGGVGWNRCRNFDPNYCSATRLDLLKKAANLSVDMFLNVSGINVGLVSFSYTTMNTLPLTNDPGTLHARINNYNTYSSTCICCGINSARALYPHVNDEFMIVISDGDANVRCQGGAGNAFTDMIEAGQAACAENITVHTIGFGPDISSQGTSALQQTACNSSLYHNATNVTQLEEIVRNISEQIILLSNYSSQTLTVIGNLTRTNLSSESYIEINYTPITEQLRPNEITVTMESEKFQNCSPTVGIPGGLRLHDAKITSYSGEHWTDHLRVNGVEVFNLSNFFTDYYRVGDPFAVQIPVNTLSADTLNNITLRIGDSPDNSSNCSLNNSFIYIASINSSTTRTNVVEKADGCMWTIEFEDGTFLNSAIPLSYAGGNNCSYTNSSIKYSTTDAYDLSVYNILRELDFDTDGRVFVNLNVEDLEIVVTLVSQVPYLWGPSFMQVVVWR